MRLFSGWGKEERRDWRDKYAMTVHFMDDDRAWIRQQANRYRIPETLVVESIVMSAHEGQPIEKGLEAFSTIHAREQGRS